jgi:NAD(P)-dependent dehydrogenase (short-subunit alcohol dehydrogenase family)
VIAPAVASPRETVAVVTGATSGIGREIALGLAARGVTTVVVGREADRANRAAREIAAATGQPRVEPIDGGDLAVRANVRALADELLRRYTSIHVLVNNAGAYFARREVTPDGLERTFSLNVLAPFLLTSLLADRLKASAPARVVNVASAAHLGHSVDFSDLQGERSFAGYGAYGRSKLELILLTREFARQFVGTGVTVNAVHPGFVRSGFGQNNGGNTARGIRIAAFLFGKSVRRGARGPLFLATDPSVATVTGQYFSGRRQVSGSPASQVRESAIRLFAACAEIGGVTTAPR